MPLSETWCNDSKAVKNVCSYKIAHLFIKLGIIAREEEAYNRLILKLRKKQSINSNDTECACINIIRKNAKNIIVSCIYRASSGDSQNTIFRQNKNSYLSKS